MKRKLKLITILITFAVTLTFQSFAQENGIDITQDDFVEIPGMNFKMLKTEVTQKMYKSVMGENPSRFTLDDNRPVECVSMYDAIYFCNKLSVMYGKEPVYIVNGESDVTKWGYVSGYDDYIEGEILQNPDANGYRLPTQDEWIYAAKGGEDYIYAGSNNPFEVGWSAANCYGSTRPVGGLYQNGYGLYDMSGNVNEWVWEYDSDFLNGVCRGGSYKEEPEKMLIKHLKLLKAKTCASVIGFRIVYNTSK